MEEEVRRVRQRVKAKFLALHAVHHFNLGTEASPEREGVSDALLSSALFTGRTKSRRKRMTAETPKRPSFVDEVLTVSC